MFGFRGYPVTVQIFNRSGGIFDFSFNIKYGLHSGLISLEVSIYGQSFVSHLSEFVEAHPDHSYLGLDP